MTALDGAWRPTARWKVLRYRAEVFAKIRTFFAARGVIEVETPLLSRAQPSDVHLQQLSCRLTLPGCSMCNYFLQTSPESAMKRLLAAGSGPIFQLCKAFRAGEYGSHHNPEFTILEWYRPGFDVHDLMTEVAEVVALAVPGIRVEHLCYGEELQREAGVHPENSTAAELRRACERHGAPPSLLQNLNREDALDFLFTHSVRPTLAGRSCFLTGFPVALASMARPDPEHPSRALRFELFVDGLELANGYEELRDPEELARRVRLNQLERKRLSLPEVELDSSLLEAMVHGLPACSGVAIGVDRLIMVAKRLERIDQAIAFDVVRA